MITAETLDKEEYVVTTKEKLENTPTFLSSEKSYNSLLESTDFKRSLVRNQWRYVKESYKSNVNTRTALQVGDWYNLKNNPNRALDYYLQALYLDQQNISIYKKIIDTYVKHKKFDEAEKYFKKLFAITNRYEIKKEYVFFKVMSLNEFSNIDMLIGLIKDCLEKDRRDPDMLSLYGFLLLNVKNQINDAAQLFKECLEINTNYLHALNNLGVCYLRQGKNEEAEAYLKRAIDVDPYGYPFSYQNLVNIYWSEQRWENALTLLGEAIARNVAIENEYAHLYGNLLLREGQLDKAISWYKSLISKEPENNLLYNNLGYCYVQAKNIDLGMKFFQKAIDLCKNQLRIGLVKDSRSLTAFYNLGRIATIKNDIPVISKVSSDVLSIDPNNPYGHYFRGVFFLKRKEYEKASELFEETLHLNKEIPELYPDYSFILTSVEYKFDKSIKLLNQALDLGYKNDFIINNLAFSYIKNNDLEKGEKIINENGEIKLGTFIATRGLLEMRKNNLEEGIKYYQKAMLLLSAEPKQIASQILELETAFYWFRKKDLIKAQEHIEEARKKGETYVSREIEDLAQRIVQNT